MLSTNNAHQSADWSDPVLPTNLSAALCCCFLHWHLWQEVSVCTPVRLEPAETRWPTELHLHSSNQQHSKNNRQIVLICALIVCVRVCECMCELWLISLGEWWTHKTWNAFIHSWAHGGRSTNWKAKGCSDKQKQTRKYNALKMQINTVMEQNTKGDLHFVLVYLTQRSACVKLVKLRVDQRRTRTIDSISTTACIDTIEKEERVILSRQQQTSSNQGVIKKD